MWFEVLPSMFIIVGSLAAPSMIVYVTNRLFLGNPYKRSVDTTEEVHYYLRDMRLSGVNNAYKQILLDCLPEAEPPQVPEKPPCVCP